MADRIVINAKKHTSIGIVTARREILVARKGIAANYVPRS